MRGFWFGVAVASCVASAASFSRAGISVTAQLRSVHILAAGDPDLFPPQTVTAPPNVPFDSSIQDSGPEGSSSMQTARASQTSSFGLTGTTFHVSMVGSAGTSGLAAGPVVIEGISTFSLTFVLDSNATYHIAANTSYAGTQATSASVTLSRGVSNIFQLANGAIFGLPDPTGSLDTGGTLAAGTYLLFGDAHAGGAGGAESADLTFNFTATPSGTASVSLPPAATVGGIVLGLMLGGVELARRRGMRASL